MSLPELDNLARVRQLKAELATQAKFDGLLRSGERRLSDARRTALALESRGLQRCACVGTRGAALAWLMNLANIT